MKKLLTLLLTLVMTVCLVNFNNSHTKADETNIDYHYNDETPGLGWKPAISPTTTYSKGQELKFTNDMTHGEVAFIVDPYGIRHTLQKNDSWTYTVEHDGVSITKLTQYRTDDTLTIVDNKIVQCDGLTYDTNGKWYNGAAELNETSSPKSFSDFGIEKTPDGVYKFTKELTITTNGNSPTIFCKAPITIELNKNLTLVQTNNFAQCINLNPVEGEYKIVGNNHTLMLSSKMAITAQWGSKLTLNNINIVSKNEDSTQSASTFAGINDLVLEGDCNIELTTTGGPALLLMGNNLKVVLNQTPTGNIPPGDLEEVELHELSANMYAYSFKSTPATYVSHAVLTNSAPKPDPSPSQPKDESCEKVIGPTWHWNNTKGICEDYGVVGTYTR